MLKVALISGRPRRGRLNCKVLLQFEGWPCHLHKCGHLPRTSSASLIMAALTAGWHAQRRSSSQEAG
jgi:hypothetical protein